ncbi:MAG: stationary phase survival protein SurE, partial [Daejeonella sp.]
MFKKDNIWFGSILGLLMPVITFLTVEVFKKDFQIQGKNHLIYILGLVINLILLRLYYGKGKESTARGIIA